MDNRYDLGDFNALLQMGDPEGFTLIELAKKIKEHDREEAVTEEYVTSELKKFGHWTQEGYRFVFKVSFRDVPKYINDERLTFLVKWRLAIRK